MHPVYKILTDKAVKRGPFATIWHARDEVLDRQVAVKELRNWTGRPVRARACFRFAHVRRLSLNHPGLAPVYAEDPDRGWVTLDYFPDGSLADRLLREGGPLPLDAMQKALVEVLETLAFLHDKGWAHGAVKPKNLFYTDKGKLLLADGLGLCQASEGRSRAAELFRDVDPEEAKYLAPECLDGKADRVGPAADLYGLGLTILEQLLGGAWFAMLFPRVQLRAQRWDEWHLSTDALPSLRDLLPDAPGALVEVIDGLLRKAPEDRLSAAAALAVFAPPPPPPAPPPVVHLPPAPAPEDIPTAPAPLAALRLPSNHGWAAGACLAGLGAGMLFAVFAWPRSDSGQARRLEQELQTVQVQLTRASADLHDQQARALRRDKERKQARVAESNGLDTELQETRATLAQARAQVEDGKIRTAGLAKELAGAKAALARVRTELQEQKTRADRLMGELQQAQEVGRKQGQVAHELESKLKQSTFAAVKRLGGKLVVDPDHPNHPILQVDLSNTNATDEDLSFLTGLTHLQTLSLGGTQVTDAGLACIKGLANLQTLDLFHTRVTDVGLHYIEKLGKLRTLSLSTTQVSDAGLAHLSGLTNLQTLDLVRSKVTDAGLVHLDHLTNLQSLLLSSTDVSDAGLARLRQLARLQTLDLSFTRVTDAGLGHLAGYSQLATLVLSSTRVSDAGLFHLAQLPQLQTLALASTQVSDAALVQLKRIPRLRVLDLSFTSVGDSGLDQLAGYTHLDSLFLASTPVTDAGTPHLRDFAKLHTLDLSFTRVSNASLVSLKGVSNLKELYLAHSQVNSSGMAELRQALPKCVLHE